MSVYPRLSQPGPGGRLADVTLIDSPYANIANIRRALEHVGARVELTRDPETIAASRRIVLPGVGSFAAAMRWLDDSGAAAAIRQAVSDGASLLGICVGHQLLFESSEEMGDTRGLGLIDGRVRRFTTSLAVPQVGWNRVTTTRSALFDGIPTDTSFYFVHSYVATDVASTNEIAFAHYGDVFNVSVQKGNVFGVQFHPEKSSTAGLRVLRNFLAYPGPVYPGLSQPGSGGRGE